MTDINARDQLPGTSFAIEHGASVAARFPRFFDISNKKCINFLIGACVASQHILRIFGELQNASVAIRYIFLSKLRIKPVRNFGHTTIRYQKRSKLCNRLLTLPQWNKGENQ
ncbi:hypothetical protein HW555_006263 [Spodoptera exigua]|uniref:Uncharacterized protein n=1 Tax=Spodoptera exigua TaxID=7107 RepID=A0A835GIG1_SPOEX|nr:hypothetical protein HW555_006263 [Spodoptera exigua]